MFKINKAKVKKGVVEGIKNKIFKNYEEIINLEEKAKECLMIKDFSNNENFLSLKKESKSIKYIETALKLKEINNKLERRLKELGEF